MTPCSRTRALPRNGAIRENTPRQICSGVKKKKKKKGVRGFFCRVNLVYALITPHAKSSQATITLLAKNETNRILLGIDFVYVDFIPPHFTLLKELKEVKSLAKSVALG